MREPPTPIIEPVDGSEELLDGFWPVIRLLLFMFLPFWVFLIGHSSGFNALFSSIIAGASISLVVVYEKYMLKQKNEMSFKEE